MGLRGQSKKNLKNIHKYEFYEYTGLVEAFVFEIEKLASRHNKLWRQHTNQRFLTILQTIVGVFGIVILPIILLQLSFQVDSHPLEKAAYVVWIGAGLFQSRYFVNKLKELKSKQSEQQRVYKYAYTTGICHCEKVLEAFFNHAKEIENIFKNFNEVELLKIKTGMMELEIDLLLFEQIVYKHQKCNEPTILLEDEYYLRGRDTAEQYLKSYLLSRRTLKAFA